MAVADPPTAPLILEEAACAALLHLFGKSGLPPFAAALTLVVPPFAPHWPLPDQVAHRLKREVPLWSIGAVFTLVGLLAYLGLNNYLRDTTLHTPAPYSQIIKLGPQSANLTISLP